MVKIVSILLLCICAAGRICTASSDLTCQHCQYFVNQLRTDELYYNSFKSENGRAAALIQLIDSDVSSKSVCDIFTICEQNSNQIGTKWATDHLVAFRGHGKFGHKLKKVGWRIAKAAGKAAICAACSCC